MESAIKWYYKRIHVYDLNSWEKTVQHNEKHISYLHSAGHERSKSLTDMKYEYVDIDLIRGSAFSKNKSQQNSLMVLFFGCFRILFFPFFTKWWIHQTNMYISVVITLLYIIFISASLTYALSTGNEFELVTTEEIVMPYVLMLAVGSIHCQIASTKDPSDEDDEWEMISEDSVITSKSEASQGEFVSLLDRDQPDQQDEPLSPIALKEDMINVRVWTKEDQCRKIQLSFVDIGSAIMRKAYVNNQQGKCTALKGMIFICTLLVPLAYRYQTYYRSIDHEVTTLTGLFKLLYGGDSVRVNAVVSITMISRAIFTAVLFVMLSTADRTFNKRFFYAKYFSYLTSCRRAYMSGLPHFRLNKLKHVKAWLSLRSYLQRRGPQRSTDLIFSASYTCFMFLLCFVTVKMMGRWESFITSIFFWECCMWLCALAVFLLCYIITAVKIHKKYNTSSILLTEQFNILMQMEKKPNKKEALQRANQALVVTAKLIKETGSGSGSIFGLTKNPIFYNLTRVIVLSAFSGAVSELLGFKVKMWKIKE